jgi:5-(carboxyamino)imidazole ribonucleotide synthase
VDARTGLPVVGMVGGGQLARMTHQAAIALGQSLRILAESSEDGAALVAPDVLVGDYRELADLRAFARGCEVLTFDHEHVPNEHLQALAADGVFVAPGPAALRFAQDKIAMRTRLTELGIAGPPWLALSSGRAPDAAPAEAEAEAELVAFADAHGWPLILKAATGGYDGRGVWTVDSLTAARPVIAELNARGTAILVEARVPIARELAAVVARSPFGQGAAWPIVETVQRDGICIEVLAPAPGLDDETADTAEQLALRLAVELDLVGVLAVELFEDTDGRLLVNELAMRPHNSGHWTIEGARTSQFEQHLRAVLDYPLGSTEMTAPVVVMANLLGGADDVVPKGIDERVHHFMARWPDVKIHLYGKAFRPGRKVGHVTALGHELGPTRERARAAADYLMNGDR